MKLFVVVVLIAAAAVRLVVSPDWCLPPPARPLSRLVWRLGALAFAVRVARARPSSLVPPLRPTALETRFAGYISSFSRVQHHRQRYHSFTTCLDVSKASSPQPLIGDSALDSSHVRRTRSAGC